MEGKIGITEHALQYLAKIKADVTFRHLYDNASKSTRIDNLVMLVMLFLSSWIQPHI